MKLATEEWLGRIKAEQNKIYGLVDRKLTAIWEHRQAFVPGDAHATVVPASSSPLARIESTNIAISAAAVVVTDLANQARAAGVLTQADHDLIRSLMSRQRMHATRVSTWTHDPRYKSETTEAIRDAVADELAVLLQLEPIIRRKDSGAPVIVRTDAAER